MISEDWHPPVCEWAGEPGEKLVVDQNVTIACFSPCLDVNEPEECACSLSFSWAGGLTVWLELGQRTLAQRRIESY